MYEGRCAASVSVVTRARSSSGRRSLATRCVSCAGSAVSGGRRDEPRLRCLLSAGAGRGEQCGDQSVGRREDREIGWRHRLIVHAPAVVHVLIERALDDLPARQLATAGLAQRAAEVDPVEAQDHVGVADRLRRAAGHVETRRERMQRMLRRKAGARLDVREHDGAEALGQRHAPREIDGIIGHAADHEQRPARRLQKLGGAPYSLCRRGARRRRLEAVERWQRHGRRQVFLLQRCVEGHEHGSMRQRQRNSIRTQDRFERRRHRSRLVVPLRVAAHQRGQIARRVDPVDPRAPLHGVHGSDAAEQQNGNAIAPRIEDRHRRVHQPDVRVQRDGERFSGDSRIAVRERDRMLLVHAEQQLRPRIAEMVDEAVVQPAKAGAGRERDIGNLERAQKLRDHIAAKAGDGLRLRSGAHRFVHARLTARLHSIRCLSP